jgi:hypothetical protein
MERKQILAVARSELDMIVNVRYQRLDAQVRRIAARYRDATQQEQAFADRIGQVEQEMQMIRTASLDAVCERPGSISIYRNMLRGLDAELRRVHAHKDAKREECKLIFQELSHAKAKLAAMDVRRDIYAKIARKAKAAIAGRMDDDQP